MIYYSILNDSFVNVGKSTEDKLLSLLGIENVRIPDAPYVQWIMENCQKWSKMLLHGSKWSQVVPNCPHIIWKSPKWSKMVPNGPKQSQIVLNGPNEHRGMLCGLVEMKDNHIMVLYFLLYFSYPWLPHSSGSPPYLGKSPNKFRWQGHYFR